VVAAVVVEPAAVFPVPRRVAAVAQRLRAEEAVVVVSRPPGCRVVVAGSLGECLVAAVVVVSRPPGCRVVACMQGCRAVVVAVASRPGCWVTAEAKPRAAVVAETKVTMSAPPGVGEAAGAQRQGTLTGRASEEQRVAASGVSRPATVEAAEEV
jgi:hypothetical protein